MPAAIASLLFMGRVPKGIRTPVAGVKGRLHKGHPVIRFRRGALATIAGPAGMSKFFISLSRFELL
jgi:hypothetical protein